MTFEYFLIPMLMNQFTNIIQHFKTDIYILDCFILISIIIIAITVDFSIIKYEITHKIKNYIKYKTDNTIIISCEGDKRSIKFRAIMWYISTLHHESIYCLKENTDYTWSGDEQHDVEKNSEYTVEQIKTFKLDDEIYGNIKLDRVEKRRYARSDTPEYVNYNILNIYTKTKKLIELQEWINVKVIEYNRHIRSKTSDIQLLLTISQKSKADEPIDIESIPWESTVKFDNSYFHRKDEIISKIDFFLNNKPWYEERGIPYNLGILLYGEPGCGKTRFIKQLINYTKRHAIDIKLNDRFDFNELKKIIYKNEIGDEYNVPQNQRIIIFEDIDAMGDIVKSRDSKRKHSKDNNEITMEDNFDIIKSNKINSNKTDVNPEIIQLLDIKTKNTNNNLSYLLNMIDGLNECSGRIIVMTTNKKDTLDPALIRPGRIDIMLEFIKCSKLDIFMLIKLFYKHEDLTDLSVDMIKPECDMKYTSAELINIFRSTICIKDIRILFT